METCMERQNVTIEESTEDFQTLYEDLQIKYHTERLIIVQKV